MIFSKHPRTAYTWTTTTGNTYGIGKILADSSDAAWNLVCLLVDIESHAHQKDHREFNPQWVGQAAATDRVMAHAGRLDHWRRLGRLSPLAFMYRFLDCEAAYAIDADAVEVAFDKAERLEASLRPEVDLEPLWFLLRSGPGASAGEGGLQS